MSERSHEIMRTRIFRVTHEVTEFGTRVVRISSPIVPSWAPMTPGSLPRLEWDERRQRLICTLPSEIVFSSSELQNYLIGLLQDVSTQMPGMEQYIREHLHTCHSLGSDSLDVI